MTDCEPRQARKGATVIILVRCKVRLVSRLLFYKNKVMSQAALARKWRPRRFDEIAGQQHIVQTLQNAIKQQRLHHAYLFTGTRGVGKTTLARIIAKCLNCEQSITPTPCDNCSSCQEIDAGRFVDLLEVDAASRTKVEDTRELLDNVQYAPAKGRYKVYLIDEVHMLSGHSFNALLKTLEEPPEHVKFLLATTEPQKLPKTVRSRCLQFHLHALEPEVIQQHLNKILNSEKIEFDEPALRLLSMAAEGSVRDSLSLLDQAIAYGAGKVTLDSTQKMLGYLDNQCIFKLIEAIANQNASEAMQLLDNYVSLGTDFLTLCKQFLIILQQLAVLQCIPTVSISEPNVDAMRQLSKKISPEEVQLFYQIILHGQKDIELAASQKSGFEMLLIRLLCFIPEVSVSTKQTPPQQLEKPTQSDTVINQTIHTKECSQLTDNNKNSDLLTGLQLPQKSTDNIIKSNNNEELLNLIPQLKLTGASQMLIKYCTMQRLRNDKVVLSVAKQQNLMANDQTKNRINKALRDILGDNLEIEWAIGNDEQPTFQQVTQQQNDSRQQNAEQVIQQDDQIQRIMKTFNATIIDGTIAATNKA